MRVDPNRLAGVYLLTPDTDSVGFGSVIDIVRQALEAGVRVVQYREKKADIASQFERMVQLAALTRSANALLIVNDSVDLAVDSGADGVHLGRDDDDVAAARRRLPQRLVGVSCYNELERARRAVAAGADAIAFGSMFQSATKPDAVRAPVALLKQARTLFPEHRIIAIGGINGRNIAAVAEAGAHAAAVLDSVFRAENPAHAASELVRRFNEGRLRHEEQRTTV